MTETQFAEAVRKYRGALTSQDDNLKTLWMLSSPRFKDFVFGSKAMGVRKMTQFTIDATGPEQDEFTNWFFTDTKVNIKDIELKMYTIISKGGAIC